MAKAPCRRSGDARPLSLEEATALLAPLRDATRTVLAVSGGPDSTALMHLAAMVRAAGAGLVVATLDHGLTDASPCIARDVRTAAKDLGLDAYLLRWDGIKPATGVQEAARHERYRLLDALAHEIGATHLVTAHTLDDQAETILFRMARGSGPAGLSGMRAATLRRGITHLRPFLAVAKSRLVATCRARGWPFVEDPANSDPRFARGRLRALLPGLAEEGLDAQTFAALARRLSRDEAALGAAADALLAGALLADARLEGGGQRLRLRADALLTAPAAVGLRALDRALTDFRRAGAPRLARLEHLYDDLRAAHLEARTLRRTLHGHIVALQASGVIEIRPEPVRRRGLSP